MTSLTTDPQTALAPVPPRRRRHHFGPPPPVPPIPANSATRIKSFDEAARARLDEYRTRRGLSLPALARELDTSATALSKYLNGKPEGDVVALERGIDDVLRVERFRTGLGVELFETSVTRQCANFFETARRLNGCALLWGEEGVGKSCGAALYAMQRPTTILAQVRAWNYTKTGVQSLLFGAIDNRTWSGQQKKSAFLVERLRGSKRLIILDGAHKLTRGARDWLFDLHEETLCPVVFLGRGELAGAFRRDAAQASFFAIVSELKIRGDAAAIAQKICANHAAGFAATVADCGEKIVNGAGHIRALTRRIALAQDFLTLPDFKGDAALCFQSAGVKLALTGGAQ